MKGRQHHRRQSEAALSDTFSVEDNAMFPGCLHQLEEVSVMLLWGITIDAYIIMYGNNAGKTVCCLIHLYLNDVLGHL